MNLMEQKYVSERCLPLINQCARICLVLMAIDTAVRFHMCFVIELITHQAGEEKIRLGLYVSFVVWSASSLIIYLVLYAV